MTAWTRRDRAPWLRSTTGSVTHPSGPCSSVAAPPAEGEEVEATPPRLPGRPLPEEGGGESCLPPALPPPPRGLEAGLWPHAATAEAAREERGDRLLWYCDAAGEAEEKVEGGRMRKRSSAEGLRDPAARCGCCPIPRWACGREDREGIISGAGCRTSL